MSELMHRIKEIRGDDSQTAAAKKCGLSQQQWSKLERGVIDVSSTATLPQIIAGYPLYRLEWLVNGTEPKFAYALKAKGSLVGEMREGQRTNLERIIHAVQNAGPNFDRTLGKLADLIEHLASEYGAGIARRI